MTEKIQNVRYTTLMFIAILFISLLTISSLSFFSIKSSKNGLYHLGEEGLLTVHQSMMHSFKALNYEIQAKLKNSLSSFENDIMSGEPVQFDISKKLVGNFQVPVMIKGKHPLTLGVAGLPKKTGRKENKEN
ncbi:hypothetical protein [Desulfogranum japonicum]|uniref:hypothetical protein n=1 Tax=Desulfogranum japonicum TaxID=231447 RepID=UPI00040DF202|nr:hypothetical protein [Desulfogranum japonicum]